MVNPALALLACVGTALTNPAWQAIVPRLVPRSDLRETRSAVAVSTRGPRSPRRTACRFGRSEGAWLGAR